MLKEPSCLKVGLQSGRENHDESSSLSERELIHIKANNRVVYKSGTPNIRFLNIPRKSIKFIKDFATTLVELKWRYTLGIFTFSFFFSWIVFALLWQLIAEAHGDLDFDPVTGARMNDGETTCTMGTTNFWGFLLLSVETQVTTGYGEKYPTEECPEGVFLLMFQVFVAVVLEGAMVGVIYAKMSKPKPTAKKFQFSKVATICQRDGELCLLFRVADLRNQLQINSQIQAYFCSEKKSSEGEDIFEMQEQLKLVDEGKVNLIWPVTVCHIIDKDSPFYKIDSKKLDSSNFEIVVTLNGSSQATGQQAQARTSYMPNEIIWSYRFQNIVHYDFMEHVYFVDYDHFDTIYSYPTPVNSASELHESEQKQKDLLKGKSLPNLKLNKRIEMKKESRQIGDKLFGSVAESGLELNIDGRDHIEPEVLIAHSEYDEDDDDYADETDEFDDSLIQSTNTILERGDKILFKKLRPNEWNAKVVSSPNIWHKD